MSDKGSNIISDIKSGLKGLHGVGETVRGNINQAIDTAAHDQVGESKNQAVAAKGEREMARGEDMVDRHRGLKTGGVGVGSTVTTGTETMERSGAHSGAVGSLGSEVPRQQGAMGAAVKGRDMPAEPEEVVRNEQY